MTRLSLELRRLYLAERAIAEPAGPVDHTAMSLIDPADRVRALVLELTRPASWEVLGKVWMGVQTALELPAPAIAVSGVDGLQLWFSLVQPVTPATAHGFLAALGAHFLPDVDRARIRLWPAPQATAARPDLHARGVPAEQVGSGNWSAFVAPDLAPIFADTPWLDIPPGDEGQASLLRGLQSIEAVAFEAAWRRLMPPPEEPPSAAPAGPANDDRSSRGEMPGMAGEASFLAGKLGADPERFLQQVMDDATVPLALRIEAAKALLRR